MINLLAEIHEQLNAPAKLSGQRACYERQVIERLLAMLVSAARARGVEIQRHQRREGDGL